MSKPPYTNAVEKLDFIIFNIGKFYPRSFGQVPIVPESQVRMIAETLKSMIGTLDGFLMLPEYITREGIEALRQRIELSVMPMTESVSGPTEKYNRVGPTGETGVSGPTQRSLIDREDGRL